MRFRALFDSVVKSKPKLSRQPARRKEKTSRANPSDKDEVGFSFAYDWLREWWEFSGPITKRSRITLHSQW